MKLARLGDPGSERPVVFVDDTSYLDLKDLEDFTPGFFENGGLAELRSRLDSPTVRPQRRTTERIGPPIMRPHQILCVGLNYVAHAQEAAMEVPEQPVVFTKAPNSLSGPHDPVVLPRGAEKLDYEVELGIVIGQRSFELRDRVRAREAIAGLVLTNDISERAFQLEHGGQWLKGKSLPSFAPCGPVLVTVDEFTDLGAIELWLDVNGERRQHGSTAQMVFDPLEILLHLSRYFVLEPGDLILTGTPPGVALGMEEPAYLRPGDRLTLGATDLGEHSYPVVAGKP